LKAHHNSLQKNATEAGLSVRARLSSLPKKSYDAAVLKGLGRGTLWVAVP
jgi:hypothetical protein